jgi:hypothetical protein
MTLISNLRMKNSHRNINIMFYTTSVAQHKEIIIATSVLVYAIWVGTSNLFFLHGRPNPSIIVCPTSYSRPSLGPCY